MLLRLSALLALVVSACGFQSDPAPALDEAPVTSEVDQAVIDTCDPVNHPCAPFDRVANGLCQRICGGDGYCLEYSAVEYAWCASHPDRSFGPGKLCSPDGDPLWSTHCVPRSLP